MFVKLFVAFQKLSSQFTGSLKESVGVKEGSFREVLVDYTLFSAIVFVTVTVFRFITSLLSTSSPAAISIAGLGLILTVTWFFITLSIVILAYSKFGSMIKNFIKFGKKEDDKKTRKSAWDK